ncbi:MAG: YhgE/Pip family protein, partial [Bacilli bacterium]
IVPANFTVKLLSVTKKKIVYPEIDYIVNEKVNAISPKITEKGASTIQRSITEQFQKVVSETLLSTLKSVGVEIEELLPSLYEAGNKLAEIEKSIPKLNEMITVVQNSVSNVQNQIPKIDGTLSEVEQYIPKIESKLQSMRDKLVDVGASSGEQQKKLQQVLTKLLNIAQEIKELKPEGAENNEVLDSLITDLQQKLESWDENVVSKWNNGLQNAIDKIDAVENILNTFQSKIPNVRDKISTLRTQLPQAASLLNKVENAVPKLDASLLSVIDKIALAQSSGDLDKVAKKLQRDINKTSTLLTQPVELITERLYPVKNYGSAISAFFTVLSVWVGALILVSVLKVDPKDEVKQQYRAWQVYFARGWFFGSIGILQATVVALGDHLLLDIQLVEHGLFYFTVIFVGIVFVGIVYTLVSVLGNVGKLLAIVLLVLQIAGSGGTFPVEVTPEIFQKISPFLPFTHAIVLLRECIGGVYTPSYVANFSFLLILGALFFTIGVLAKAVFNRRTEAFQNMLEKEDLL